VARTHQQRHQPPPDDSACAGDKNTHLQIP
jgi:hypothetical protein